MEATGQLTLLEEYQKLKQSMDKVLYEISSPDQVWYYQELFYRISVIETLYLFYSDTPKTDDIMGFAKHFKMLNRFLKQLPLERKFNDKPAQNIGESNEDYTYRLEKVKKSRLTAHESLQKILQDHGSRFGNQYNPSGSEQYQQDVANVVHTVMTAWVMYRNALIMIETKED